MLSAQYDAIIIGSGPNGLAAAIELARAGQEVLVLEAKSTPGGGMRTAELTLPGFHHDVCSGCHPMAILSPFLRTLPLADFGLTWKQSNLSVAHPLDGQPAVLLSRDLDETARGLGVDAASYRALLAPFLEDPHGLFEDALGPLRFPNHPWTLLRFGLRGMRSARGMSRSWFKGERARALAAGCAGHAVQPLETPFTAAMTLIFLISAHMEDWPVPEGGAQAIATAMVGYLESLGGQVALDFDVTNLAALPATKVVLFDTGPDQLASIGAAHLPETYTTRLRRYRFGPGSFKVDWALDGPIPWADPRVGDAATVHLGGTLDEICASERAMWKGEHCDAPYVLLVQQSALDASRAPPGRHTGYAYCHVPHGSTVDRTAVIEDQIERFAPGFKDRVLAKHTMHTGDFVAHNRNYVGGAVTGGVADIWQLFTRPVARLDPYSTPNPHLGICSAATPPGGGVHGMCGYFAARSALARLPALEAVRFG